MFSRSWRPALAIAVAAGVGWSASTVQAQVTYTTTEAKLTQILQAHRYGGHVQVWADIRTEPVSAWGNTYPGRIVVHARDYRGGQCSWSLVIEPHVKQGNDWFFPRIFSRVQGCYSTELNDDNSILAFGVSNWRMEAVNYISQQTPIGNPLADLLGKVEYYSDRVVFSVHRMMIKIPETMRPPLTERLTPRPFQ